MRNVLVRGKTTLANVFVPTGKLDHSEKLIRDYLGYKRNRNGYAIDNQKLLDTIQAIQTASVQALWTDHAEELPEDEELFWCEVWLAHPRNQDRDAAVRTLRERAQTLGMWVVAGEVPLRPPVARPVLHDLDAPGGRGGRVEKAGDRPSSPMRSVPLDAGPARTPPKVSEIGQLDAVSGRAGGKVRDNPWKAQCRSVDMWNTQVQRCTLCATVNGAARRGEKRPADDTAKAALVGRFTTGQADE